VIAASVLEDAESVARTLTAAVPDVVIATWGGTARGEATPRSDLDLLCWNPEGAVLPEVAVRRASYLDLVTCVGDASGLILWARSNATDLHALMFSRVIGGSPALFSSFRRVSQTLWRDSTIRAREVYHLLATCVALPQLHGRSLQRPEKFALGGTRCWTALAECGSLISGRIHHQATEPALRELAALDAVDPRAPAAFAAAMRLRVGCEHGEIDFDDQDAAYEELSSVFLSSARRLLARHSAWLGAHAGPERESLRRLTSELLRSDDGCTGHAVDAAALTGATTPSETEIMLRALTAGSRKEVADALASPHGDSWWVRHAAIMNAHTHDDTLRLMIRHTSRNGQWWADRNLILYAIRHPNASRLLLEDIVRTCHGLRLMDVQAIRARRATLDFTENRPELDEK
jgi:hypothetical protein